MPQLVATQTFHFATKKAGMVAIKEGQVCKDTDPAVKGNPQFFVPLDEWAEGQSRVHSYVEAATAAPGEARAVKKPAAKKSKKVATG